MRKGRGLVVAVLATAMFAWAAPAGAPPMPYTWYLTNSNAAGPSATPFQFGNLGLGDIPMPGDWDCVGDEQGVVRPLDNGRWRWIHGHGNASGQPLSRTPFDYGNWMLGDIPVVGNWDGNASGFCDSHGVVRPMDNGRWRWLLKNTSAAGLAEIPPFDYGSWRLGDLPIVGDWNFTNDTTPGVVRINPDNGRLRWLLRNMNGAGAVEEDFEFGNFFLGDFPIPGNWDGSGSPSEDGTTPGVVRLLDNGRFKWILKNQNAAGGPLSDPAPFEFGNWEAGDFPVVGNWDDSAPGGSSNFDTAGVVRPPQ